MPVRVRVYGAHPKRRVGRRPCRSCPAPATTCLAAKASPRHLLLLSTTLSSRNCWASAGPSLLGVTAKDRRPHAGSIPLWCRATLERRIVRRRRRRRRSPPMRAQVSYRTVFFLEYLGPLLIYPFFWSATGRRAVHGLDPASHRTVLAQDLAIVFWSGHYLKVRCPPRPKSRARSPSSASCCAAGPVGQSALLEDLKPLARIPLAPECAEGRKCFVTAAQRIYETFHVHNFSHATMPIFNLARNFSYYSLFAAFISYNVNHPRITEPPVALTIIAFALAYLCEVRALCIVRVEPGPWDRHWYGSRRRHKNGAGYRAVTLLSEFSPPEGRRSASRRQETTFRTRRWLRCAPSSPATRFRAAASSTTSRAQTTLTRFGPGSCSRSQRRACPPHSSAPPAASRWSSGRSRSTSACGVSLTARPAARSSGGAGLCSRRCSDGGAPLL